jgi:steroid 5-alpha reductase family enzyme
MAVGRIPIFATAIALAFGVQWFAFIPSFILGTERFYDLVGSITYIGTAILATTMSGRFDVRGLLLLGMVAVWAVRLGSFLFRRVLRAGKDDRFAEIKRSFLRFLLAWTLQGLWVSFTVGAALAAITSTYAARFGITGWIGCAVWLLGFGIEAIADEQKRRFRAEPTNRGRFIRSGLWAWSRHPNYFGEIVLWLGVAIVAAPVLRGWQWVTVLSPVFVAILLTRVSGIPILEKRADERWGGQPDYESYKRRTPVLILRRPKLHGDDDTK